MKQTAIKAGVFALAAFLVFVGFEIWKEKRAAKKSLATTTSDMSEITE